MRRQLGWLWLYTCLRILFLYILFRTLKFYAELTRCFLCVHRKMPPRRVPITLEEVDALFDQKINNMLPNLVSQIAQLLHVHPSQDERSGTQGRRTEDEEADPNGDESGNEGGGGGGPEQRPPVARAKNIYKKFSSCNP